MLPNYHETVNINGAEVNSTILNFCRTFEVPHFLPHELRSRCMIFKHIVILHGYFTNFFSGYLKFRGDLPKGGDKGF